MIESQEDASATPTVLADSKLRSDWQDTNDTKRRNYAENQWYKPDPRYHFDNPRLLSPEEEQKVRYGRRKGKKKTKARAGSITGNKNNKPSSNAAKVISLAGGSRGGVNQESHPKNLNEGFPSSF